MLWQPPRWMKLRAYLTTPESGPKDAFCVSTTRVARLARYFEACPLPFEIGERALER